MKQYLAWIWLVCGLGLLLMGLSSSWDERAFHQPHDGKLHSYTGSLQQVIYRAPAKSPTLVEVVLYHKKDGIKHGYLRYGLHEWKERLKPYMHQEVSMLLGAHQQIWGVDVGRKPLLKAAEIEQRLQGMKQAQQAMADKIVYAGFIMVLLWLFLFRQWGKPVKQAYS